MSTCSDAYDLVDPDDESSDEQNMAKPTKFAKKNKTTQVIFTSEKKRRSKLLSIFNSRLTLIV